MVGTHCTIQRQQMDKKSDRAGLETNLNYPLASRASDLENLLALLNSTSPDFFLTPIFFARTTVSIKTHSLNVNFNDIICFRTT